MFQRRKICSYIPHYCNKYIELIIGRNVKFLLSLICFAPVGFISPFFRNQFVY